MTDADPIGASARAAPPTGEAAATARLDALAEDLRRLRLDAGDVSYAEIASRIAARRVSEGRDPGAARIARSTVFDAFQTGRRRINPALVQEIVLALGYDADEAERWRMRYLDARRPERPTDAVTDAERDATNGTAPAPATPPRSSRFGAHPGALVGALLACVGLNVYLGTLIIRHEVPLYLDMIGTAAASFAFGPWFGALVALITNLLGSLVATPETIVFALVNITGALVWGIGIRRFAHTFPRFILLTVAVALACSIIGAPLNVLMYGGPSLHSGFLLASLAHAIGDPWAGTFGVNIGVSIIDKTISGAVGLLIAGLFVRWGLGTERMPPVLLRRRGEHASDPGIR
ncbi:ECF transporter S component [uncultured Microbacterium sp.]|uniref:ECF transporter S component n=1 Tax=uncultured Microbacterium sp. TaxID=191216 RepID=UPI0028DB2636|nr:ECF transporter S component [uncultured Microbacterium sp.]